MHIVDIICILSADAYVMYMFSFLLLLFAYVHVIRILYEHMYYVHIICSGPWYIPS